MSQILAQQQKNKWQIKTAAADYCDFHFHRHDEQKFTITILF
jgi:hypothetical protein